MVPPDWSCYSESRVICILRMSVTGRSYTQKFFKVQYIIIQAILSRKSMHLQLRMKKYPVSIRLLTVKQNNSHANMRTSHAQLLEKDFQHGEEDSENKICHKKVHHRWRSQNNRNNISAWKLSVHWEANCNCFKFMTTLCTDSKIGVHSFVVDNSNRRSPRSWNISCSVPNK